MSYFYPRPPRGGRHFCTPVYEIWLSISIHALREEGDRSTRSPRRSHGNFYPRPPRGGRPPVHRWRAGRCYFYPRPPRGGRRPYYPFKVYEPKISIHALREEGDLSFRRSRIRRKVISIHALREEGDENVPDFLFEVLGFLSTPSARRATAKTETKSLFSNKLYNILHEFRRALIYNGSKNYPNHAK